MVGVVPAGRQRDAGAHDDGPAERGREEFAAQLEPAQVGSRGQGIGIEGARQVDGDVVDRRTAEGHGLHEAREVPRGVRAWFVA